jgi:hypothetical protein
MIYTNSFGRCQLKANLCVFFQDLFSSSRPQPCPFAALSSSDYGADTLTNKEKTIFYKFNVNEMYPDHVLVYRDLV